MLVGAGESVAVEPAQAPVADALQKAVERNYQAGGVLLGPAGPLARDLAAGPFPGCRRPVRRRATRPNSPFVPGHFVMRRHPLRRHFRDCLPCRDKSLI